MEKQPINPWLHLWTEPRKTMRSILTTDPNRMVLLLAILGGIFSALSFFFMARHNLPYKQNLPAIGIIAAIIAGAIFGIIHLYFAGWLYRLTGSWVGGKGNFTEVKSAVGWSNYPFIITSIISILSALAYKQQWLVVILGLINFVLAIWGIVIFLKILSEAHQFSVWKGLLTVLIAAVLIAVVIMLIALLIPLLKPLFQ